MSTYIALIRYTQQGMQNIKESPARLDAAKKAFQVMGGELKQWYLTLGQYDAIAITEVPDNETIAKLALAIESQGSIRIESLHAFPEDEYRKLIAALP